MHWKITTNRCMIKSQHASLQAHYIAKRVKCLELAIFSLLLNIVSYWTGYTLKIIEQAFSALFNSVSVKKQNQPRIMKPDQGANIARCLGVYKVGEPFKCLQLQVWFSI